MKNLVKFSALLFAVASLNVACDEELGDKQTETEERLGDYVIDVQSNIVYLYNLLDQGLRDPMYLANDSTVVDEVIIKSAGATSGVTLDFGVGVTGKDGILRSGIVMFNQTGDYNTAGSILSATFSTFAAGEKNYVGDMSLENLGANAYKVDLVEFGFANEFSANLSQTLTWVTGFETDTIKEDDSFTLSGTFSGIDLVSSDTVAAEIISPFNYDKSCEYGMVEGAMDIVMNGPNVTYESGSIDFISSDGCLDLFQIVVSDGTDEVTVVKTFKGF
jgi:hypothetical protein